MAYADIDAGKVLNKEGLLELSNQIKSYVDTAIAGMPDVEVVRVPFNQTFAITSEIGKKLNALNKALNNHTQTPNYIIILTDGLVDYQVVHYEGYTAMPYPTLWTLQNTNDGFRVFAHPFNSNNGYVKNGGYVKSNYVLPTATTSTLGGVKVDGTTITISNGVISATSSGGGSNTDIGDVIQLFYAITASPYNKGYLTRVNTGSELLAGLLDGKLCITASNWNTWDNGNVIYSTDLSNGSIYLWEFGTNQGSFTGDSRFNNNTIVYWDADKTILYKIPFYIWNRVYLDNAGHTLYSYLPSSVPTTGSKVVVLNSGAPSWQDYVSLPTAPTTDGNYVLKVSVSSGTPTYSWVAE